MRQHGVARVVAVRPANIARHCHRHRVLKPRATFGHQQHILPSVLVKVRALHPNALAAAPPQGSDRPHQFKPLSVELLQPDFRLTSKRGLFRQTVRGVPSAAIVVEEQRRVDAFRTSQCLRRRPWASRIGGRGDKRHRPVVHDAGGDNVKATAVETQRGRLHAAAGGRVLQPKASGRVHGIAHQFPVHQVATVVDGQRREILETGIDEVVVRPHSHDGRVGLEAREDGVLECGRKRRRRQAREQQPRDAGAEEAEQKPRHCRHVATRS